MLKVLDSKEYLECFLHAPRPGAENIMAFYDHRIGYIGRNPSLCALPVDDRLVHRGDGVFETLKYAEGRIYQLDPHLERLKRSGQGIFLELPCSLAELREMVLDLARAAQGKIGLIRILVGRGLGGFGVDPLDSAGPSLYMIAYGYHPKPEDFFEKGASACRSGIPAKPAYLGRIKTVNYLPNALMKREATLRGCDFPVCFDEAGFMAEGAVENICVVDEKGVLILPNFDQVLPGTTVLRAAELIKEEISAVCRPLVEEELFKAKEIIAVGTTIDAVGIVRYNAHAVGDGRPGPVALRMRELLRKDFAENGVGF